MKLQDGVEQDQKQEPVTALGLLTAKAEVLRQNMHEGGNYLPRFKLFQPIEGSDYTHKCAILGDGDTFVLDSPYILIAHGARKAARQQVEDAKGNTSYDVGYEGGRTHNKYLSNKEAAEKDKAAKNKLSKFKIGKSYLLSAVVDDKITVVTADFFGAMLWYWEKHLGRADFNEDAMIQVNLVNHGGNFKKEFKTYDYKSFKEVKQLELPADLKSRVREHADKVTEKVKFWLER